MMSEYNFRERRIRLAIKEKRFSKARALMNEVNGTSAPVSTLPEPLPVFPETFLDEFDPDAISDVMRIVNDAYDTIGIVELYDKLIGGRREQVGSRVESIKAQCPLPNHTDEHPSAWFNTEKNLLRCGRCEVGWNRPQLACLAWGITHSKADFAEHKKRLARELRGVDYDRLRLERAKADLAAADAKYEALKKHLYGGRDG